MDCLGKIPTLHERILAKTGISSDDHKDTGLLKTLPGVWSFPSFFSQIRKAWPQMNNGVQLYSWILLKMIGKRKTCFPKWGGGGFWWWFTMVQSVKNHLKQIQVCGLICSIDLICSVTIDSNHDNIFARWAVILRGIIVPWNLVVFYTRPTFPMSQASPLPLPKKGLIHIEGWGRVGIGGYFPSKPLCLLTFFHGIKSLIKTQHFENKTFFSQKRHPNAITEIRGVGLG